MYIFVLGIKIKMPGSKCNSIISAAYEQTMVNIYVVLIYTFA